jgi:hypothetical protein
MLSPVMDVMGSTMASRVQTGGYTSIYNPRSPIGRFDCDLRSGVGPHEVLLADLIATWEAV